MYSEVWGVDLLQQSGNDINETNSLGLGDGTHLTHRPHCGRALSHFLLLLLHLSHTRVESEEDPEVGGWDAEASAEALSSDIMYRPTANHRRMRAFVVSEPEIFATYKKRGFWF
jgi:hypothetical protein